MDPALERERRDRRPPISFSSSMARQISNRRGRGNIEKNDGPSGYAATGLKFLFVVAALVLGAVQLSLLRGETEHNVPITSPSVGTSQSLGLRSPLKSSALPVVRDAVEEEAMTTKKDDSTVVGNIDNNCPSGSELGKPMVLNFSEIKAFDNKRFHDIKEFTDPSYEQWLLGPAGSEHHILLHYIATHYSELPNSTCPLPRHLVDIGTRYVASALAMASASPTHPKVYTFDIPSSSERVNAFRGKSEEEWQAAVKAKHIDITFHNLDLLAVSDTDFRKYMNTWFILLDTFHEPYSVPFEREWIKRLVDAKFFKGVILLDDIRFNDEMKKWWNELKENAHRDGYIAYDVTKVGHSSGTGLLDFSGDKVTVIDNISL